MTQERRPTAAELAALMDGSLSEAQRADVIARIEGDADLRAMYADAVAIATELDAGETVVPVAARTTGKQWHARASTWGVGIALAATLFIAVMTWKNTGTADPQTVTFAAINAVRNVQPVPEWKPVPLSALRGSRANSSDEQTKVVRLGMLLIDYQFGERSANEASLRQTIAQSVESISGLSHLAPQVMRDRLGAQTIAQAVAPHVDMESLAFGACVEVALLRGAQTATHASCGNFNRIPALSDALDSYLGSPSNETRAALEAARDRMSSN